MGVWIVLYIGDTLCCGVDVCVVGVYDNYDAAYETARTEYNMLLGCHNESRYTPDFTWYNADEFHAGDGVNETHTWIIKKTEVQTHAERSIGNKTGNRSVDSQLFCR